MLYLIFIIFICVLVAILCVWLAIRLYRSKQLAETYRDISDRIVKNINAYVILIDSNFDVVYSNYYLLTKTEQQQKSIKIGNMLHCKNGEDAGACGDHALCNTCPVRAAINQSFVDRKDFSSLESSLVLYTSEQKSEVIECDVSVSGSCVTAYGQELLLLTLHDITAQRQIRQQLIEAHLQAEASERMKSLLLDNASHELRTPLNAIVGFSELLSGNPTAEEKSEYIRIIRANNEHLLQMVDDILDMSQIEAGTLEYVYTEVDLHALMEELERIYQRKQHTDNPVEIRFNRDAPLSIVRTDRNRLAQVLSNFLSNAVKFTTSGEIEFGYEIRGKELYYYVRDTGCGVEQERLGMIFERFTKSHTSLPGSGIGLALNKAIIEAMDGQIGVESTPEVGSTFWISLPYTPVA